MKKLTFILIMITFLFGCQSQKETTVCTVTLNDPVNIKREISLYSKDNVISKVESVETFILSESFDKEMFLDLQARMVERHKDSKNLVFSSEVSDGVAKMKISLSSIDTATTIELMLIGVNKDDAENVPGLIETVRYNENAGYTCKLLQD